MSWAPEDSIKLLLTVLGLHRATGVDWNDVAAKSGTGRSNHACQ